MSDLLANLALGFGVAAQPYNILFCLLGALVGTLDRRAAGHRPGRDHRDAAADHLRAAAGRRADHARRHLLRRAVRRLDHLDPGQHPGRDVLGGDLLSTATRWRGRAAPAPRLSIAAIGSFFAGCVATVLVAALGAPLTGARAAVRPGRILLADGARPDLRGGAGEGLGAQGARDDPARPAAVDGRLRSRDRRRRA